MSKNTLNGVGYYVRQHGELVPFDFNRPRPDISTMAEFVREITTGDPSRDPRMLSLEWLRTMSGFVDWKERAKTAMEGLGKAAIALTGFVNRRDRRGELWGKLGSVLTGHYEEEFDWKFSVLRNRQFPGGIRGELRCEISLVVLSSHAHMLGASPGEHIAASFKLAEELDLPLFWNWW